MTPILSCQIIFIDIRDRFGKTQVILSSDELIEIGKTLSNEDVIHVSGKVTAREKDLINPDLSTGEIEVLVEKIDLLSTAGFIEMIFCQHSQ